MHHADLYRNLHRIHGNMVLSLLWGQLSSKTIPHVSSSAVFIHHSSDSRHAVLFRLSDFCGISSFPELAQPVRKTHGNRRLRLRHRTVHVIYAVILGPVCEELVFRGVTMRLVRRALPFWAANLMQAVLFGIFHMNWIQGIYAFVLGLVLGWICEKGGSIYFSMFFHILFNFWGTIIGPLLNNLKETDLLGIIIFLFTIVSLVLGFSLFRLGTKWRDQKAARLMAAPDHDDHFEAAE